MNSENKNMEELIRQAFAAPDPRFDTPPVSSHQKARKLVASYRKTKSNDLIMLLADFLNLRVRLYHAVVASIFIWVTVLFFAGKENQVKSEIPADNYTSNLVAVKNSTVLSSIQTFVLHQ